MGRKEVLHGFAGMVTGAILDQQEVLLGWASTSSRKAM
jgi:hypothetical protein